MVWVYVVVTKLITEVLIIYFEKSILGALDTRSTGYNTEKSKILGKSKKGFVNAAIGVKNGLSIRVGSPTHYGASRKVFWKINWVLWGARPWAITYEKLRILGDFHKGTLNVKISVKNDEYTWWFI